MDPLGTAEFFIKAKRPDKAKVVLDLMRPYCTTVPQMDVIGKLYAEIREFDDTLDLAFEIYHLAENPQLKYDARVNIIRAYLNLNRPHDALTYIKMNEIVDPTDHPNQMDKAMAYFLLNRKAEGEAILRKILTEPRSEDVDFRVKFNLGTYDLANGNFKEGLSHVLLDGRKLNIWETFNLPLEQQWEGGVQPGKTIVMCAEGGIGDEIISVRFQRHFREAGMRPIWYTTRRDLAEIFHRNGFEVTTSLSGFPGDWLWCYSMPSPTYLDLSEDDLWSGPYIKPIGQAKQLEGAKKIGIKYMGNPKYDQDLHRTIPLDQLIDSIPEDYTIYAFHVDEDVDHPRVQNLRGEIKSWDDTLDFIDQMDIVVSSCTSLIHAAGAMGKESVVIVPILNYYTWAKPEPHSRWYGDNLTVLRQTEYDNWNSPMAELKVLLREKNL